MGDKLVNESEENKVFGNEITSYIVCLNCESSNYDVNMLPKQVTCKQGNKVSHSRYVSAIRTKCFQHKEDAYLVNHK